MYARVVVYRNEKQELCVPIAESGASIGRDAGNEVQLLLPEVSKRHAHIHETPQGWHVRDLDSRNGLYVNGKKVQEALLQDGDRLMIGPYTVVFQIAEAAHDYTPILQIDLSTNAAQQTMPAMRSNPPS